jgi:outer membrane protein
MIKRNQAVLGRTLIGPVMSIVIFLSLSANLAAAEYTLDDLYRIALERSEKIKISEEDVYISEKNKDKALSLLFPKLSAVGTYTGYKDRKYSTSGSQTQPDEATSWSIRLDQTLSTSGRELIALKIAKDNIEKNKLDLFSVKEAYMFNVTGNYFDVLRAGKLVEISRQNISRLIKYRDAASTRLKIGEVTKTALLRAEAELSGAQSDLVKAENQLNSAKILLQRTVGLEGDYDLYDMYKSTSANPGNADNVITDPLALNCPSPYLECLTNVAFNERAEIKSLTIQKNKSERQVAYTRGAHWPTVALEGVFIGKNEVPAGNSLIRDNVYGGVRLTFPLFEGGLRQAETGEAMAKKRQVEYALDDLKKSIGVEVENAYLDYVAQREVLKSSGAQVAFARENFNAVSKQFDFGLAQSIDVMDANTVLVTAQRQFAQVLYNYEQSIVRLKRVTGMLLKSIADTPTDGKIVK